MKVAVLVYHEARSRIAASLLWVDVLSGKLLHSLPVPRSVNLGVFPDSDCALVSGLQGPAQGSPGEVLDVYRLSDWCHRARLPMDCRCHFNVAPRWSTFLPSPDPGLIYVYKAHTLGHHRADDYICGLRLGSSPEFTSWNYKLPECVAGWSLCGGRAHVQLLFVAEGLQLGRLPAKDLEQKVAFWLGPEEGCGPSVSLGPRPRAHSDLGHARAILSAPKRRQSVVVCNDGMVHLIDAANFRHLGRQQVELAADHAMPLFAAQLDASGRLLYVGTAAGETRCQGLTERIVVHDLEVGRRRQEWLLAEPMAHLALTGDGRYVCGAGLSGKLWVLDALDGRVEAAMPLPGSPRYVVPVT